MTRSHSPRLFSLVRNALLLGSCGIALHPLHAQTQIRWNGGDGDWGVANRWHTNAVPTSLQYTDFQWYSGDEEIAVTVSGAREAAYMRLARNQRLTLEMAAASTLTFGGTSRVGQSADTNFTAGTGSSTLTLSGPVTGSATVSYAALFIQNASSLILGGSGLQVNSTSMVLGVGAGHENHLIVGGGAKLTVGTLDVGHLTVGATSENHVGIQAGSELTVTGKLTVGAGSAGQHSSRVEVAGAGAFLKVANLDLGDAATANLGGHRLTLSNGGRARTSGTTYIGRHKTTGTHYGANTLAIDNGGTYSAAGTINNFGLVSLAVGGVLEGRNAAENPVAITHVVNNGGRFEAAGSGLASNVTTRVLGGGTMAVGAAEAVTGQTLTLSSTTLFEANSVLELSLHGDGSADTIHLLSGATLSGSVILRLTGQPSLSGPWKLFTGVTTGISATFDLTELDLRQWDTSRFNQAGGWELQAVPEPSTLAFVFGGAMVLGVYGRRLRRR